MSVEDADELQEIIEKAQSLPVWNQTGLGGLQLNVFAQGGQFGRSLRDIALWVALRESDRDTVRSLLPEWGADRAYRVDPLADRIVQAFADLLFGEDPKFTAATEADQGALTALVEANDLPSEFRRWSADCSSEGEIWWRVYTNRDVSDFPVVEAHSRLDVMPLFRGRRIPAVAFFSDLWTNEIKLENTLQIEVWRHVEIQTEDYVRNLLFQGDLTSLGVARPLTDRSETAELDEDWNHGLGVMLAGRIPNKLGRDWRLGISDYQGIKDQLLDLNEARVIMAENARLTAKKRMVVPANALDENGNYDAGADVLTVESLDTDLESSGRWARLGPYTILEYTFDANALLTYINDLVSTALTRVGLTEQFTGGGSQQQSNGGGSFSGTALRTKLIPTTLAAAGKARFWDDAIPKIVQALQLVDALPTESGGGGHSWRDAKNLATVERSNVLPEDPTEEVNRHVTAVAGEVESVESAVRALNPDADDKWLTEELDRIKEDRTTYGIGGAPPPPPGAVTPGEGEVAPGGGTIGASEAPPA